MTGPGENTYCRNCGVRADAGQAACANCGAVLPTTPNTIRTDAMAQVKPRAGVAPGLVLAGIGLAAAPALLLAGAILRRRR